MEFKDYQQAALERLSLYLDILKKKKKLAFTMAKIQKDEGMDVDWSDEEFNYPEKAWRRLNKERILPFIVTKEGEATADYRSRFSGLGDSIPNVCLKVPTGGGKTLLAAAAIERINVDFLERGTGFVLWVVPSDAIYKQTLKALSNREHLYRQCLDRITGGRIQILQKLDSFNLNDIKDYLCIMVLMLQSSARESKEALKVFKDSGKFTSFFPDPGNYEENNKLRATVPNLDIYDLLETQAMPSISIKQSLGNTLRLIRPIIIIDEGHRAYTENAKETLCGFNPCFMLELSATPNKKEHHSNVLVSVSGSELKREEMIKLPINLYNLKNGTWKSALSKGYEILDKISKTAEKIRTKENTYIRPIMLVRVERTGKDQRERGFIHSEDVKDYLVNNFNVPPEEVRIKTSTKDELGKEDLLSEYSKVRYIITKDALKEGWDCPFASVLTILSKTKASTALEQMIGRVLRQPYAKKTKESSLNESYVICIDQEVNDAVSNIKKGLEKEGMDGLAGDIETVGQDSTEIKKVVMKRRKQFKNLKIFLPKVLHKDNGHLRDLSYERDLLYDIDWDKLSYDADNIRLSDNPPDITHSKIDIEKQLNLIAKHQGVEDSLENLDIDFIFMCRRLSDVIPNPWQASRIVEKTLRKLQKKYDRKMIYKNRFFILDNLRLNLQEQVSQKTEKIFRKKIKNNLILFKLVSAGDPNLNWELAQDLNLNIVKNDRVFRREDDRDLQLSLFNVPYQSHFNATEKRVAWYLDEGTAIKWWHRVVERQDWHLQGWQKNKVYPDFLACVNTAQDGSHTFSVLETKGKHLIGNEDTEYKKKLFQLLEEYSKVSIDAGTIEIKDQEMTFDLILEETWKTQLNERFGN